MTWTEALTLMCAIASVATIVIVPIIAQSTEKSDQLAADEKRAAREERATQREWADKREQR